MLLAKVQRKADTIAHQHARLDATHEVLRNLLTNSIEDDIENDDDDDVDALMLSRSHTEHVTDTAEPLLLATSTTTAHSGTGVSWGSFSLMVVGALSVGFVVESARIRFEAATTAQRRSYSQVVDERTAGVMDNVAEAIASKTAREACFVKKVGGSSTNEQAVFGSLSSMHTLHK